jgi:AbrB family looped-hinge helix DNA binding protein
MTLALSKLTTKAQTTIPKEVRKALDLKAGDSIAYDIQGNQVILRKADAYREGYGKATTTCSIACSRTGAAPRTRKPMTDSSTKNDRRSLVGRDRAVSVHGPANLETTPRCRAIEASFPRTDGTHGARDDHPRRAHRVAIGCSDQRTRACRTSKAIARARTYRDRRESLHCPADRCLVRS